ncbi:MAG: YdcF family protein [Janthinobacterium lividum]
MKRLLVLFGAAVRADGRPSETLARRIGYAAAAAEGDPGLVIFCSGGVGRHGPSEASVMARMLGGSVSAGRLHLDEASRDTLETVRAATAYARGHGIGAVVSCTDSYHQPRVRMLFAIHGLRCSALRLPRRGSRGAQWRMRLREVAAIPYDLVAGTAAAWTDRRSRST